MAALVLRLLFIIICGSYHLENSLTEGHLPIAKWLHNNMMDTWMILAEDPAI